MKYFILLLLLIGWLTVAGQETPHKVDSSLRYRWPNASKDTLRWPLTYGWYDTVERGGIYEVFECYPPPPNCRCWDKCLFKEYLDKNKLPIKKINY